MANSSFSNIAMEENMKTKIKIFNFSFSMTNFFIPKISFSSETKKTDNTIDKIIELELAHIRQDQHQQDMEHNSIIENPTIHYNIIYLISADQKIIGDTIMHQQQHHDM
jgi:hypothetical protein